MSSHALLHGFTTGTGEFLLWLAGGAVVFIVAALIASGAHRISPRTRHGLLWLAVVAPLALLLAAVAGAKRLLAVAGETPAASAEVLIGAPEVSAATVAVTTAEWPCALVALWIAGSVVALARLAKEHARWRAVAKRSRTEGSASFDRLAQRLGVSARLGSSDEIREPVVVGVLVPSVLLPEGYADDLSDGELASIFLHELAHVHRRDNLAALASEVVLRLFWFDPLHWFVRRRLLELRERACDAAVLDHGGDADGYLSALGKTCAAAFRPAAVSCMSGFRIRERMDSIMTYTSTRASFLSHRAAMVLSIIVLAGASLGFGVAAPEAELAVMKKETGDRHRLVVQLGPDRNGVVEVRVHVTTPSGFAVMQSFTVVRLGQPVKVSTLTDDGKRYEVAVSTEAEGGGRAVLEVFDRGVLVETVDSDVLAPRQAPPGAKIDLHLREADLHDVLKTMSQLTGVPIEAARGISGKVTISVEQTPWDVALAEAIRPLGLTFISTDGKIWVIRGASTPGSGIRQQREDGVYRVGGDVKPPRVVSRIDPIYPPEARTARIAGIVIVEAVISETGVVQDVKVLKGLPFGLSEAAADAIRQWIFSPATIEGKAVPVVFNLTVNFVTREPES